MLELKLNGILLLLSSDKSNARIIDLPQDEGARNPRGMTFSGFPLRVKFPLEYTQGTVVVVKIPTRVESNSRGCLPPNPPSPSLHPSRGEPFIGV